MSTRDTDGANFVEEMQRRLHDETYAALEELRRKGGLRVKKNKRWDLQPAITQLLPEQQEHLIKMLEQVGWQKTGKEIFEAIMFGIFPAVPSECAIVREINGVPHVLMWYRNDNDYTGHHMPGKYMIRGQSDEEHVRYTLLNETGLTLRKMEFIRRFNTRPDTGWVSGQQIAQFWYCQADGEPIKGTFYPLTALPEDTLGHHRKYIDCLRAFLLRRETMRQSGICNDGMYVAPEWGWLVVASEKWKKIERIFYTLHDALDYVEVCKNHGSFATLFDDLGQEICRTSY